MEYLTDPILLKYAFVSFFLGTGLGAFGIKYFFQSLAPSKTSQHDKIKLEKQVLEDEVKQLKAKIKTLEKAMDMLEN